MDLTIEFLEVTLPNTTREELIRWLQDKQLIKTEFRCIACNTFCFLKKYQRNKDGYAWRCLSSNCPDYLKYFSIRVDSFFSGFDSKITDILRVLAKFSNEVLQKSIISSMSSIKASTVRTIVRKLVEAIPVPNFTNDKLGGFTKIVQADETMMNYKCKSHRGRSPYNRTDALVIVEVVDKVTRVFARVIPDKKADTILPIICAQVVSGATIHTDEHRSYSSLSRYGYIHGTVCHKYTFVDSFTGVDTQSVESINNCIKYYIKMRKGISTELRQLFLNEFCFRFNNKGVLLSKLLDLIKVYLLVFFIYSLLSLYVN